MLERLERIPKFASFTEQGTAHKLWKFRKNRAYCWIHGCIADHTCLSCVWVSLFCWLKVVEFHVTRHLSAISLTLFIFSEYQAYRDSPVNHLVEQVRIFYNVKVESQYC